MFSGSRLLHCEGSVAEVMRSVGRHVGPAERGSRGRTHHGLAPRTISQMGSEGVLVGRGGRFMRERIVASTPHAEDI